MLARRTPSASPPPSPALGATHMPADTHDTTIRRLEPHDQGAYRALRLESLRTNPALFGTTYAEAAAMPSLPFETFIRERAPDHAMFGAFVDGTLVGLCGFRRETRERARHSGELVEMYVAPHVAGRGLARGQPGGQARAARHPGLRGRD